MEVYSKYPQVRLYLNDQLVGEKFVGRDTEMKANGEDLSFVQVEVVGKEGRVCPNAAI